MNDEEIEYITDLLFNENWKEQKDLILFTKDLKTANRRLAEQVKQLQSNWNSLRRWLQEQNNFLEGIPTFTKEIEREHKIQIISYDYVLDKMNELEGKDKECR